MSLDLYRELGRLRAENDALRAELRDARALLVDDPGLPTAWRLTPVQTAIVLALVRREVAPHELLLTVCGRVHGHVVDRNTLSRHILNLRRKLKPFGVDVGLTWGVGYSISPDWRVRLAPLAVSRRVAA